jgi:hypothetical protein
MRQALPDGITSFVATHVEKRIRTREHRIKCQGGETPDQQMELVSKAFTAPMEIGDLAQAEGEIHIQCAKLAFTPCRFMMNHQRIESWQQPSATNKQREKLASISHGERVTFKRQLFDDGEVLVYEMVPFKERFINPKGDRIKTRQIRFPGAPAVVRPTVETRKKWGDPWRRTYLVDSVENGSRITKVYDPTQRITDIDPDVEELVRGHGREIHGDIIPRDVTWTEPAGDVRLIKGLKIPVRAGPHDLMYRLSLAMKKQELNAQFAMFNPEDWRYARAIAVSFDLERQIIIITFTWSRPRGVAGYTEAHACAWHVCQLSLSDP